MGKLVAVLLFVHLFIRNEVAGGTPRLSRFPPFWKKDDDRVQDRIATRSRPRVNALMAVSIRPPYLVGMSVAALGVQQAVTSEAVRRAMYFWYRAGPMIVHYKFAQWWLETSGADRETRDRVYGQLHDKYADPAYRIMIRQKGLYVKVGQVSAPPSRCLFSRTLSPLQF